MADSKSLKTAVKKAVGKAESEAKTGNVETVPQKPDMVDLPTGARSRR